MIVRPVTDDIVVCSSPVVTDEKFTCTESVSSIELTQFLNNHDNNETELQHKLKTAKASTCNIT